MKKCNSLEDIRERKYLIFETLKTITEPYDWKLIRTVVLQEGLFNHQSSDQIKCYSLNFEKYLFEPYLSKGHLHQQKSVVNRFRHLSARFGNATFVFEETL